MASSVFAEVEVLILSGGGGAGRCYPAALIAAVELGSLNLQKIRQVWGTSVGAIMALGVALGMTTNELKITTDLMPSERFRDSWIGSFWQFLTKWGWFRGKGMVEVLNETIADAYQKKYGTVPRGPLSFDDFFKAFGKDLRVVTTNLLTRKPYVFCAENTPNEYVAEAIARSAGIPLAYPPFRCQNNYLHVDGGLMANYAAELACAANPGLSKPKMFGLVLMDTDSAQAVLYHLRAPITSLWGYFKRVWSLIYLQLNTVYAHADKIMTVVINYGAYDIFRFEPTELEQKKLNAAARDGVIRVIAEDQLNRALHASEQVGYVPSPVAFKLSGWRPQGSQTCSVDDKPECRKRSQSV